MGSLAQAENERRSENIRLGLAHRATSATSGLYNRKLYGYNKNKDGGLVIDDEQSKVAGISFVGTLMEQAYLALSKNFPIQVLHLLSARKNGIREQ